MIHSEFIGDLFATMDIETITINGFQIPVLISLVDNKNYSLLKMLTILNKVLLICGLNYSNI
jgi:hypothetical protein